MVVGENLTLKIHGCGQTNKGNCGTGVQSDVEWLLVKVCGKNLTGDWSDPVTGWIILQVGGKCIVEEGCEGLAA